MTKHLLIIAILISLISFLIFLPYLRGEYDSSAAIVSSYSQVICFLGLILVPVGIIWLIAETSKYRRLRQEPSIVSYIFARFSLVIFFIIFLLGALVVFMNDHLSLAIISIIFAIYFFIKTLSFLKKLKNVNTKFLIPIPFYLIIIPLIVFLIRFAFIEMAVTHSRKYAIQNAEQLISDIESYYRRNGQYPVSMLSLYKDYKLLVKGIGQYHYELNGKSYNIYFEQNSNIFGLREIVMYNKLDEHEMTSHDQDLLLLTEGELAQQRGYFKVQNLPEAHWKYFWFD